MYLVNRRSEEAIPSKKRLATSNPRDGEDKGPKKPPTNAMNKDPLCTFHCKVAVAKAISHPPPPQGK